jgi:uncharacterized membrane protein YhaH (DUF805 family)
MKFLDAVKAVWEKRGSFQGCSSRFEYAWFMYLVFFPILIISTIVFLTKLADHITVIAFVQNNQYTLLKSFIESKLFLVFDYLLFLLCFTLYFYLVLPLQVRRKHDLGNTGWSILIIPCLVTIIGYSYIGFIQPSSLSSKYSQPLILIIAIYVMMLQNKTLGQKYGTGKANAYGKNPLPYDHEEEEMRQLLTELGEDPNQ